MKRPPPDRDAQPRWNVQETPPEDENASARAIPAHEATSVLLDRLRKPLRGESRRSFTEIMAALHRQDARELDDEAAEVQRERAAAQEARP